MNGWRTSASDCTGNQIVDKYSFISTETFKCRLCNRKMQRKGSRQITVIDTPYMQYDIALQIETPFYTALIVRNMPLSDLNVYATPNAA